MYSLIVSIYKIEKYLPKCIESILAQTYRDFEVILVDDGSPDNCPRICDEYAKRDSRVRVIHKENGGLVSSRKAGLAIAQGEFVCFVDGDDFLSCDLLEKYQKILTERSVDIVCAGYSNYYSEDNIVEAKQSEVCKFYDRKALEEDVYPTMLSTLPFYSFGVFPSLCAKAFRRELVTEIYGNVPSELTLGEDVAVSYLALLKASSACLSDYCGYMYRQNLQSMTHTYDARLFYKLKNLVVHLQKNLSGKGFDIDRQVDEYIFYLLTLAKNNEFKFNKTQSYREKKRSLKRYLNEECFNVVIKRLRVKGFKNSLVLNCFKHSFFLPIFLYERFSARGK